GGLLVFAGLKATWMGTVKASALKHAATTQQVEEMTVPARRGTIYDRTGRELAVSEPADDVAATPYLVKDPVAVARRLAPRLAGHGLAGLEYSSDAVLRGHDGTRRLTKDALQQPIAVQDIVPDEPGKDLHLSLDAAIQSKVEAVLGAIGEQYRPKGATAIVMD